MSYGNDLYMIDSYGVCESLAMITPPAGFPLPVWTIAHMIKYRKLVLCGSGYVNKSGYYTDYVDVSPGVQFMLRLSHSYMNSMARFVNRVRGLANAKEIYSYVGICERVMKSERGFPVNGSRNFVDQTYRVIGPVAVDQNPQTQSQSRSNKGEYTSQKSYRKTN